MAVKTFTVDDQWNAGIEAQCDAGYRTLAYSGNLGGGTLRIYTQVAGGSKVALADAKLSAAMTDSNGDTVFQMVFQSSGTVWIHLTGSTAPNAIVSVQ